MLGGTGWANGINSNNRQIGKDKWFDQYEMDWTTVYRCPDDAANWAVLKSLWWSYENEAYHFYDHQ